MNRKSNLKAYDPSPGDGVDINNTGMLSKIGRGDTAAQQETNKMSPYSTGKAKQAGPYGAQQTH